MGRNCLILGSGRSGTSLTAGVLAKAGYFMGEDLYPPNEGNPKGQFEAPEINAINEALLVQVLPPPHHGLLHRMFFRSRPRDGQRWLARLPLGVSIPCPADLAGRISAATAHRPLCFKDPRFCYTLPVWRGFIEQPVFVCVFREPAVTAASILAECARSRGLSRLHMKFGQALQVWELMYRHVLEIHHPAGGDWLFLHYNQFLDGSALAALEARLEVSPDRDFVDPNLRRSRASAKLRPELSAIYRRLCELAEYNGK